MNRARVDFGGPSSARCGGFSSQYFEYGAKIQQKRAFTGTRKALRFYSLQAPKVRHGSRKPECDRLRVHPNIDG